LDAAQGAEDAKLTGGQAALHPTSAKGRISRYRGALPAEKLPRLADHFSLSPHNHTGETWDLFLQSSSNSFIMTILQITPLL
jgi:hypothetical protein